MKKVLGVSILAALLAACADSGQGGPGANESGQNSSVANVNEPGVAPEPGTIPTVKTGAVTETPARPAPLPSATQSGSESPSSVQSSSPEASSVGQPPVSNEQGPQASPEPKTGDDANPDSVNPRR